MQAQKAETTTEEISRSYVEKRVSRPLATLEEEPLAKKKPKTKALANTVIHFDLSQVEFLHKLGEGKSVRALLKCEKCRWIWLCQGC